MELPFKPADILLPHNIDMEKWSVIACDQFSSQPDYWQEVEELVGENPSTFNLIIPEVYLGKENKTQRIKEVNDTMKEYLQANIFKNHPNSLIYLERASNKGLIRKGIVGVIDLKNYSYDKNAQSLIRSTEGTILERAQTRAEIRENACLELPHILVLIDDEKCEIIEGVEVSEEQQLYDFYLMKNGGQIKGYQLNDIQIEKILNGLSKLAQPEEFNRRYNLQEKEVLLFAVGDGNHALAAAKTCYEKIRKELGETAADQHPARYALVEIVNLHNQALEFEAIHRLVFAVDPLHLIGQLREYYQISERKEGQQIKCLYGKEEISLTIENPRANLTVGSLQLFLDDYLQHNSGRIDYVHDETIVRELAQQEGTIGFLLPKPEKRDFFKTIILEGELPRKTFSLGSSNEKRYYLEARRITENADT